MPPKQSPSHQAGFVAKKEDFPLLSPSLGGSASAISERTAQLEEVTSDLLRGHSVLVEGQQQLSCQIGELVQAVRALSVTAPETGQPQRDSVRSPPPSVAAQHRQRLPSVAAEQQISFVDHRRYVDVLAPGFESTCPPPPAPLRPHLFSIENDPTFRTLSASKFKGALEEYQLLVCHAYFLSCTVAAQTEAVAAARAAGQQDLAQPFEDCLNSLAAIEQALRQCLHYIRLSKGQPKLTQSDQLFAEYLRSTFQPAPFHLGCPETTTLYEQFRAKEIECSLAAAAKAAARKKHSASSSSAQSAASSHSKNSYSRQGH